MESLQGKCAPSAHARLRSHLRIGTRGASTPDGILPLLGGGRSSTILRLWGGQARADASAKKSRHVYYRAKRA
eukprot:scaffold75502_cov32-Tisochrysis_lutea.AAC.7